ncbi:hypothetical protein [Rhodococcus sp. NPDC127528]|uniref:hypothetical protein n=1 Tax=unclassified Rhodococcus (in: high G+C Gram-positive bacteria) TaxID=192944 RepID=UPI003637AE32
MDLAPEILAASQTVATQALGGVRPSWQAQDADSDETFPRQSCTPIYAAPGSGAQMLIAFRATRDAMRDSIGLIGGNPVDAAPFFQLGAYSLDTQSGAMGLLGKTQNMRTMFTPEFIERRFYAYNSFQVRAGQYYVLSLAWWQNNVAAASCLQGLGAPQSNINPPFGSALGAMARTRTWSTRPADDVYMPESLSWSSLSSTGSTYFPYLYLCSGGDLL